MRRPPLPHYLSYKFTRHHIDALCYFSAVADSRYPEWNAVGTEDYFIEDIGEDGVLAQFVLQRDAIGCPDEVRTMRVTESRRLCKI